MGRMRRRARMWYWQDWHIGLTYLLEARDESMVAPSSLILPDMGMGEQLTSTWVMLSSDLLRGWVPRRMASDFSGFKARPLWKNQEVRCTSAVSRRLTRSGSYFLIRKWKLVGHLHVVVGQHWTDWWQIEWGRWRKWTGWIQEPKPWGMPVLSWVVEETKFDILDPQRQIGLEPH